MIKGLEIHHHWLRCHIRIISLACVLCLAQLLCVGKDLGSSSGGMYTEQVLLGQCSWFPKNSQQLIATLLQYRRAGQKHYAIRIDCVEQGKKKSSRRNIFSAEPRESIDGADLELAPSGEIVLGDRNLGTFWRSPYTGRKYLLVYCYSKGAIHQVLYHRYELRPEFLFRKSDFPFNFPKPTSYDSKSIEDCLPQSIVFLNIPNHGPETSDSYKITPETADVYTWDSRSEKYKAEVDVPWLNRFN